MNYQQSLESAREEVTDLIASYHRRYLWLGEDHEPDEMRRVAKELNRLARQIDRLTYKANEEARQNAIRARMSY